jgi:hypothetical protein
MDKPISYDITFCISECNNKKCERNFKYLVKPYNIPYYSTAYFKGSKYCIEQKEKSNG